MTNSNSNNKPHWLRHNRPTKPKQKVLWGKMALLLGVPLTTSGAMAVSMAAGRSRGAAREPTITRWTGRHSVPRSVLLNGPVPRRSVKNTKGQGSAKNNSARRNTKKKNLNNAVKRNYPPETSMAQRIELNSKKNAKKGGPWWYNPWWGAGAATAGAAAVGLGAYAATAKKQKRKQRRAPEAWRPNPSTSSHSTGSSARSSYGQW